MDNIIKFPTIEVKFGTIEELNEQVLSVYIKTITDVINASRGDINALTNIRNFAKEVVWLTDSLIYELKNPNGEKRV